MGPEDQLILSKGHAAAALYSVLAEEGLLTEQDIATFYQDGTLLAAHPPPSALPRIPFATGSLGHGLSMACGLAVAHRLRHRTRRVFCVCSEGDLNEGSTWEAALFLTHHALNQVVWIIDRNYIQGFGRSQDVLNLDPLDSRLTAFGFDVFSADGHDFHSLQHARIQSDSAQRPAVIICHTTKGRGWPGFENTVDCHYRPIPNEQHSAIHAELDRLHSPEQSTVPSSNIAMPNGPNEPVPQPTP